MSLSILESRLLDKLPEKYHEEVQKEFARFEMERNRVSPDDEKIGQATLTEREIQRLPTTNQHSDDGFTTIQLQCIKGAAMKYGVRNWVERVDSSLTYKENMDKMKTAGTKNSETLREMKPKLRL